VKIKSTTGCEFRKSVVRFIERRAVAFRKLQVRFWDTHPSRLSIGWVWNYGPSPK